MNQTDKETKALLEIRCDELCEGLRIDVMKEFACLKASKIILNTFFEKEAPAETIVRFAIHLLSQEN